MLGLNFIAAPVFSAINLRLLRINLTVAKPSDRFAYYLAGRLSQRVKFIAAREPQIVKIRIYFAENLRLNLIFQAKSGKLRASNFTSHLAQIGRLPSQPRAKFNSRSWIFRAASQIMLKNLAKIKRSVLFLRLNFKLYRRKFDRN